MKPIRTPFSDAMARANMLGLKDVTRRLPSRVWERAKPGDVIVMTETHALVPSSAYRHSDGIQQTVNPSDPDQACIYKSGFDRANGGFRWRPSIHMPYWASRFRAPIVSIRRERLQDITEEDAVREGFAQDHATKCFRIGEDVFQTARFGFEALIDSIHGAGTWESNPEVFRVEYATPRKEK